MGPGADRRRARPARAARWARGRSASTGCRRQSPRVHDRAARAEDTDWPQILALYGLLEQLTGNPVVTLNRAVAAAMADGPAAGLAVLDSVAERLDGNYRVGRGAGAPARAGR